MKKRILSILLAIVMVVSLLPVTAFATGTSYAITNGTAQADSDKNHGYIDIDKATAAKDATVTVTVNANEGYALKSLTVTPVEYVEIGGLKWATKNLGAEKVTDYGDYFAWGETAPYYEGTGGWPATPTWKSGKTSGYDWQSYCGSSEFSEWSTLPYDDTTKILKPEFDAAAQILGNGWRMPTKEDFTELAKECLVEWTDNYNSTGVAGVIVWKAKSGDAGWFKMSTAGKGRKIKDDGSQYDNQVDHTFSNTYAIGADPCVFFPAAGYGGYLNGTSLGYAGAYCRYWSSSLTEDSKQAYIFGYSNVSVSYKLYRYYGYSVRPVMNFSGITPAKQTDGTYQFTMPGYAVTVTAEFEETTDIATWSDLQDAINAAPGDATTPATATTTIKLTNDLTAPAEGGESITIPAGKDITLDLNGKVLNANGGKFSVIEVDYDKTTEVGGTLTVIDSAPTTEHKGYVDADGLWHLGEIPQGAENCAAKTITGGCITGGKATNGGGVYNEGTFAMYAGNIAGNVANASEGLYAYGGGVYSSGTFTMKNGYIIGNIAHTVDKPAYGGGVHIQSGTFIMEDGSISDNTARYDSNVNNAASGGGVNVNGTFTMKKGIISGNKVYSANGDVDGGGVHIAQSGTFTLEDGSISGNMAISDSTDKAAYCGGVYNRGTFIMKNGHIDGNTASSKTCRALCGGLYANGTETTVEGGTISNNKVIAAKDAFGAGVYVAGNKAFTMKNGEISGNMAQSETDAANGGGLFSNGAVTLGGTAKITGNTTGSETKTANNLYLNGKTISLGTGTGEGGNGVAAPASGFEVGVTTQTAPTADTPVQITTNGTADDTGYFTSDNSDYEVKFNTDHLELAAVPKDPIFDACGGTGAVWDSDKKTVSTPTFGDYVFTGWYTAPTGGDKVESGFAVGTTYYAHWWTNSDKNTLVLTEGIEVKATGVYIGGSAEAAEAAELAKYGLAFAAATDSAPATLTMTNASIEAGDGIRAGSRAMNGKYVYAGIYSDLAIELNLTGENKVSITRNDMTTAAVGGYFYESLKVTGSGALTFDASNAKGYVVRGLSVNNILTNSATLIGKAGKATNESYGVQVRKLLNTAGTLTGYAGSAQYANGLNCYQDAINITGGKVIGYGGTGTEECYGLWTNESITVSDTGILELHGGTKGGEKQAAMYLEASDTIITISGRGRIVADSDVKSLGRYSDNYYTVTGAQTDITYGHGLTLTKAGDADIEISAKEYTVKFNANGGTPAPETVTTLAYVTEPLSPVKSGYAFAGWYKDAAFTMAWDFDDEYVRANTTLYAKWVKEEAVAPAVSGTVKNELGAPVEEAWVYLMCGDVIYDTYMTDSNGVFSFSNVPAGEYQLVATGWTYTTTALVTVASNGTVTGGGEIKLYTTSKTSSAVEITGKDTPDVMVGGLAEVAFANKDDGGKTVSVTLEVEKLAESAVKLDDKTKIEDEADNTQTLDYIDMTLLLKVGTEDPTPILDTEGTLLEVVIPYHLSGRNNIALYRQHGDEESAVKLPEGADNKTDDGEYVIIDKENNLIRAHLRYFSTYAIGYEEEISHGGGGGGASSYAVELPANVKNGKVEVSPKNASAGQTVTLTVTPDKGFTLETLTVLDKNGKEIEVKNLGNNKFSFKMPSGKVSISATFMEDNTMLNFFVDVKATDYFYDAVLWAAENDITKGTDAVHFSPNAPVTRAQVVTFLWRAAGKPVVNYAMNMSDVKSGEYYSEAVRWALAEGITKGTDTTTFSPDEVCTRGQIVTFLARFAGVKDEATGYTHGFTDVKAADYFNNAVAWAKDNKVTEGTSKTTFSPNTNCTRAQVVTFLYRWMVK